MSAGDDGVTDISDLGLVSTFGSIGVFSGIFEGIKGVSRRVTFVKSALIGEVCRYYADDYIIWNHRGKADRDRILNVCRPKPELMTQRYLFVEATESGGKCSIRSFSSDFVGMPRFIHLLRAGSSEKRIKDLAPLVDKALSFSVREEGIEGGDQG